MGATTDREVKSSSHTTAWVAGLAVLFLLYALSPGPVAWWVHHRNAGKEPPWVARLYAPLIYGCNHFKPMDTAYDYYFDWWIN
jgi:hypothetical protein